MAAIDSPKPPQKKPSEQWRSVVEQSDLAAHWLGEKAAYALAALIAFGLWAIGAFFTVRGLTAVFPPLLVFGRLVWVLPVGISMVELLFFKRTGLHLIVFFIVSGVDVLTTVYGTLDWAAGRELHIGASLTVPDSGLWLVIPVTVFSFLLTFGPEKLFSWALYHMVGYYDRFDY